MRDKKRIPKILKEIEKVWTKYPDLRLSQLLCNACYPLTHNIDIYNLEDEGLLDYLSEFEKSMNVVKNKYV